MNKRKDKNKVTKTPTYLLEKGNEEKSVLLLVEGETEQVYFDKLKQNSWLKNALSGVEVKIGVKNDIDKYRKLYRIIWLISDNDKRNAFNLVSKELVFWETNCDLPQDIIDKLSAAYIDDSHRYFLSIYDYLQWLEAAIGADNVVQYWDAIQYFTPIKNTEWQHFDNKYIKNETEKQIKLAYSCMAVEFWLLLHFEQNKTPFLWVEKGKSDEIDIFEYFKNHHRPFYEKGEKAPCNAYTCLYDNYKKTIQTQDDDWTVIYRIITACANTKWLQSKMQPILARQNDKWYEVNPYIKGLDVLLAELLNLKYCNERIIYQDAEIIFRFERQTQRLFIKVLSTEGSFTIESNDLKIKYKDQDFLPIPTIYYLPNEAKEVLFEYENLPLCEESSLILVFKLKGFQKQLLVVL